MLCSTAGPFARLGKPVVAACVASRTDYVDINGEPLYMRDVIAEHDAAARAAGVRVVLSAGFDSVPFDLGVAFAAAALRALVEDALGVIEYPTRFSRFQNVNRLWLFFEDCHGADHTTISYIGLSGVGTEHKREAVQAVYESRAQLSDHTIKDQLGAAGSF